MKFTRAVAILILIVIISGCNGKSPELSRIGVFVDTGSLVELTLYVKQVSISQYNAPVIAQLPEVMRINSFFVNIPEVNISECQIFWMKTLKVNKYYGWQKKEVVRIDPSDWEKQETRIEKTNGGVYKILSDALQSKSGGFVGLKLSMPLGTPDRIYIVKLK